MSIPIRTQDEIQKLRESGNIVAQAHKKISEVIKPGMSTQEIDDIINDVIVSSGAVSSFYNYNGFPKNTCISINEEIVHGVPSEFRILKEGDIVSIDIGAYYNGYHGDSAWTYPVGKIDKEKQHLIDSTEKILFEGLDILKEGIHLSDVSHEIEKHSKIANLGVVRELSGHGVGKKLHEEPTILNYGEAGRGPILKAGMVLAIEPMLNLGTHRVKFHDDGWTVTTADRKASAHFEHTIVVTKDGYEILTSLGGNK